MFSRILPLREIAKIVGGKVANIKTLKNTDEGH